MKNKFLFLGIAAALFIACEADDTSDIVITDNSVTNNTTNNTSGGGGEEVTAVSLNGLYTQDLTLDPDIAYTVTGPVLMANGTTLTIPAGMTIEVEPIGVNAYIAIQQGAQIIEESSR